MTLCLCRITFNLHILCLTIRVRVSLERELAAKFCQSDESPLLPINQITLNPNATRLVRFMKAEFSSEVTMSLIHKCRMQ